VAGGGDREEGADLGSFAGQVHSFLRLPLLQSDHCNNIRDVEMYEKQWRAKYIRFVDEKL
jgi:hypothetical protein